MTFDDAIEVLANSENNKIVKEGQLEYGLYRAYDVVAVLQKLKEEYAPTIEMTKPQKDLILRNQDEDKLYEIMGDGDGYYFNTEFWGELRPNQVASAYLHPKTIKVVDNEQ